MKLGIDKAKKWFRTLKSKFSLKRTHNIIKKNHPGDGFFVFVENNNNHL